MKIWGRKHSPENKYLSVLGIKGRWNSSFKSEQEKIATHTQTISLE